MDSARFQPVGGNHAIEVMAIAVEWVMPPLGDEQLASLQALYEANTEIKNFFSKLQPMQAFVFQAGLDGNAQSGGNNITPPPQFTARNGGFDLQSFDTKGRVVWVASIRPEFISVSCTEYDRWHNIKPKALAILLPFVEAALAKGAKINAIGLQYQDAFRLLDGTSQAATQELFRRNGRYLPQHLFDQPSFWHCHQGWFSKAPDERRILNNVATEIVDVNGAHFARIGGQHRLFATLADGLTPKSISSGEIDQILQCLHGVNKNVINEILSDDALKAIGCTVGGK